MANKIAIEEAKRQLNRTPFAAYDLYITRLQNLRHLQGIK